MIRAAPILEIDGMSDFVPDDVVDDPEPKFVAVLHAEATDIDGRDRNSLGPCSASPPLAGSKTASCAIEREVPTQLLERLAKREPAQLVH